MGVSIAFIPADLGTQVPLQEEEEEEEPCGNPEASD